MTAKITTIENKNYPLQNSTIATSPKIEVGATLEQRIGALVGILKAFNEVSSFAARKGTKAICAASALTGAVSGFFEGNMLKATVLGAAGLKEAYDLFMKDGSLDGIQTLLKENQAGLELTGEILNFNKIVLKRAAEEVNSIGKNLTSVQKDLARIESISVEGQKELKEEQSAVVKLYQAANQEYALAQENFKKSKEFAQKANDYFIKTIDGFSQISALRNKPDAQLSDAIEIAEKMAKSCKKAQSILQKCMVAQDEAKLHSDEANKIYREASFESGKVICKATETLTKIKEINAAAQKKVQEAQNQKGMLAEKVELLQQNHDYLTQVNDKLQENNDLLMEQNFEQYGLMSIIGGAVPGALLGNTVAGGIGAVAGAYTGLQVVHNRNKIARKTADWAFGIKKETMIELPVGQISAWKFDDNSSGFWGRYVSKKGSQTVGTIALRTSEKETFQMRFNLNDKNYVKDADLNALSKILTQKVNSNQMPKEECLNVIRALETMKIGERTLINSKNPFFALLKLQCSN